MLIPTHTFLILDIISRCSFIASKSIKGNFARMSLVILANKKSGWFLYFSMRNFGITKRKEEGP